MRQRRVHAAGGVEQARQADRAQRVQPVGILHQSGFDGFCEDAGGETVAFNRVDDGGQLVGREVQFGQLAAGQLRRLARGQMSLGIVLGQVDQIVQIAAGQHYQRIGLRIIVQQQAGVAPHAVQVVGVVGAVHALRCRGQGHQARVPVRQQAIHQSPGLLVVSM